MAEVAGGIAVVQRTEEENEKLYTEILKTLEKRAPSLVMAKAMGVIPSLEEMFFLGGILNEEVAKRGLPKDWFMEQGVKFIQKAEKAAKQKEDVEEARVKPYRCSTCGRRYPTSDNRNKCMH